MSDLLAAVELQPSEPADSSVVWMHGLGADGHDFEDVAPLLELPRTRFVFPHADIRPVTINGGMQMRAWYDILSLEPASTRERREDVEASALQVHAWLAAEEARGVPSERIVLAGFSQGAAMALYAGLRYPKPLAGILALSGYMVVESKFIHEAAEVQRKTPVLLCHGSADPVVPMVLGQHVHHAVSSWSQGTVDWQVYPIGHQVSMPEIRAIAAWLHARLP